jgi:purine-binding chemotaxis protein CheW
MKTRSVNKYVIFSLDKTIFGIHILKTREIVEYGKITPVPEAPSYIKGVINLRGMAIPVIDLSKKFFNMETVKHDETGIIITEFVIDNETIVMGFLVDKVIDVFEINADNLSSLPKYGSKIKSEYILNVSSYNDEFVLILDLEKVVANTNISDELKNAKK